MTQQAKEALERHYQHVYPDWDIKKRLLAGDTVAEAADRTGKSEQDVRKTQTNIAIALGVIQYAH